MLHRASSYRVCERARCRAGCWRQHVAAIVAIDHVGVRAAARRPYFSVALLTKPLVWPRTSAVRTASPVELAVGAVRQVGQLQAELLNDFVVVGGVALVALDDAADNVAGNGNVTRPC